MRFPDSLTLPSAENTFLGAPLAQSWSDLCLWEHFLNVYMIRSLIELGTWRGGMAIYLSLQGATRGFNVTTIDSRPTFQVRAFTERFGAVSLEHDVFDLSFMQNLIDVSRRPRMLFCDNGNKPREVREIAPLLERGDFVAVHDWNTEVGSQDIPPAFEPVLLNECEATQSLTRFFILK